MTETSEVRRRVYKPTSRIRLRRLQKDALAAASWRGHSMSPWLMLADGIDIPARRVGKRAKQFIARSWCTKCKMVVDVETHPPANGIGIGGRAVASDCAGPSSKFMAMVEVRMGDDEWEGHRGGRIMDEYAQLVLRTMPHVDLVEVREHAGWFITYFRDCRGEPRIAYSANDQAVSGLCSRECLRGRSADYMGEVQVDLPPWRGDEK